MGYYASIEGACLRVDLDVVNKIARDKGYGDDFDDALLVLGYDAWDIDPKGNVEHLGFNNKYRGDEQFWRDLAPGVKPDTHHPDTVPFIQWQGEEHEIWRFVFRPNGTMEEHGGEVVFGYEPRPPKAAVVEPLALEGRAKQLLAEAIERHIEHHIELDGKDTDLVRECQMAIKSVRDADKVALKLEVRS